jgi:hypothetical protein
MCYMGRKEVWVGATASKSTHLKWPTGLFFSFYIVSDVAACNITGADNSSDNDSC